MHLFRPFLLVPALFPSLAYAGIGGVVNAQVDPHQLTMQLRSTYNLDQENPAYDHRWQSRIMADYGLDDNNAIGFFVQGVQHEGEDLKLDALILEHRYEWHEVAKDGFYSGFRLRYTYRDEDKKADEAHIRLILGAPWGKWDFRLNQFIGREVGNDSTPGTLLETRGQATYEYSPGYRVGLENFSNFGKLRNTSDFQTQAHEIGPVFKGPLTDQLSYEAGYRYGYSDAAPDHTFRIFLIERF